MPGPADDAGREGVLATGGLHVTDETLRRRLTVAADLAHSHAAEAVSASNERDALRWQLAEGAQVAQVAELRVQLDAVTAELDRLRSIPELRAGQRLRHATQSLRRPAADPSVATSGDQEPENISVAQVEPGFAGSTELPHVSAPIPTAVVTARNRGKALREVVSRLKDLGVIDVFVVDNASSDPAVAQVLDAFDCTIITLDVDLGNDAPWASGVMARQLSLGDVLDVAGSAVPSPECPSDVLDRMVDELRRHPEVDAVELRENPQPPSGGAGFRLLRQGLRSRPVSVATLHDPYVATAVRSDLSEPSERYARLHDDINHDDIDSGRVANG